jgi:PPOX class probable F420-dependent enzyme
MSFSIDEGSEFGARVARHLREDLVVWLTTVSPSGAPLPSPVWFLWEEPETVRLHSVDGARVRNLRANPRVALSFRGDERGGDIVVLTGTAAVAEDAAPADEDEPYLAKYVQEMSRLGYAPASFAAEYSVPIAVTLTGVRGH